MARGSSAMALGTIVSRGTGFVRTFVLLAALGVSGVSDAYNTANTIPNIVYDLLLGGVLSSAVVPLLVRSAREDDDGGEAFTSTLFTLVAVALVAVTIVGELAAKPLTEIYISHQATAAEHPLAVSFTRLFLPQLLFYALTALAGAVLNIRGRFGAVGLVPVINNVVVIGVAVAFYVLHRGDSLHGQLSHGQTLLLGLGTTLGVVAMALALLVSLARAGVRLRWAWNLSDPRLRLAARLGGWVLAYAAANQIGYVVISQLATGSKINGVKAGGATVYASAYQLFQLPHAIVAVSVISALMPRLSAAAADGDRAALRIQLSRGLRMSAVLLVPGALGLAALADPICRVFGHGSLGTGGARLVADTLTVFAVGLPAFSAYQLLLRAFYARQDTRTPTVINVVVNLVNIVADIVLVLVLPGHLRLPGLAAGFGLSYLVGVLLAGRLLTRDLNGLDGPRITRLLVRVTMAAVFAAATARVVADAVRRVAGSGTLAALVAVALAVVVAAVGYLAAARRLRVREIGSVLALLPRGR